MKILLIAEIKCQINMGKLNANVSWMCNIVSLLNHILVYMSEVTYNNIKISYFHKYDFYIKQFDYVDLPA